MCGGLVSSWNCWMCIYISVLLPLINCFIDSTCAFCVYCKCPIISNAWPLECEELKHLMTSLTFCFFTPQHFFSVQQGFLWVFYATRLLLEDFSLVFCVSLLQIFSELCRKQGWAKNRLCLRYWLIEEKEGYSHDFRLQEKHELPFYSPWFNFMSNTSLFLCFHSWPIRRNESAKFATMRLSGNRRVTQTPNVDLAKRINTFIHSPLSYAGVAVCLLWDLGGKVPFAAESWCLLTEDSASGGPDRSGSY